MANKNYIVTLSQGEEKIVLGDSNADIVDTVDINLESLEKLTREKISQMRTYIKIVGSISISSDAKEAEEAQANAKDLQALFDWSRSESEEKWYRELKVEIKSGGNIKFTYLIPKVFVVNYSINYTADEKTHYTLELAQKANYMDELKLVTTV